LRCWGKCAYMDPKSLHKTAKDGAKKASR